MRTRFACGLLVAFLTVLAVAQTALTNDAIVKMTKAGLSEDIILSTIKTQPAQFQTGADALIALKQAGVSDKIIAAMVERAAGGPATAPAAAAEPPAPSGALASPAEPAAATSGGAPITEVGVYYKKNDAWTDLPPEIVNFKSGGVLKTIGTAGIVKGDVNGHVNGEHSSTQLKTPVNLLVYTPEGTAITEYQLLHMRQQKDSREFRTMTGGVFHVSGGATRDLMTFESKKIAPRTYVVELPNLGSGEYGLFPPSAGDSTGASGRIGKIYSFGVIE